MTLGEVINGLEALRPEQAEDFRVKLDTLDDRVGVNEDAIEELEATLQDKSDKIAELDDETATSIKLLDQHKETLARLEEKWNRIEELEKSIQRRTARIDEIDAKINRRAAAAEAAEAAWAEAAKAAEAAEAATVAPGTLGPALVVSGCIAAAAASVAFVLLQYVVFA